MMVEFETLRSTEVEFGDDEFLRVARKKAISGEGEDEFLALARGTIADDGDRRVKSNFQIPLDADVVEFVTANLPDMLDGD